MFVKHENHILRDMVPVVVQVFGEKGMLLCENIRDDPVLQYTDEGCTASLIQYSFPQRYVLHVHLENIMWLYSPLQLSAFASKFLG